MEDTTDIAAAQTEAPDALREALLDQMRYLVDEVEALRSVVDDVPEQIKSGRPAPDALTMKEVYGALITLDADVRRPRLDRLTEEETPALESIDVADEVREDGWNDQEIETILDQVQDARRALLDELEALPPEGWHQTATLDGETVTLFDLAYRTTQDDAERLRSLGYRLHGAHLSNRDEPLPT